MSTVRKWYRAFRGEVSPLQFWAGVALLAVLVVAKALAIEVLDPTLGVPLLLGVGDLFGTKKGVQTTQSTSEPWRPIQPYLTDVFQRSQNLANQGFRLAPFSSETQQAHGLLTQRALSGSPVTKAAQNYATGLLTDPMSNPYISATMNRLMGDAGSRINAQFQGDNYGSSAHREWLGRGLMDATAPVLAQFQQNAMGMAPALAGQDYADLGMLSGVGAAKDARAQAELDAPWTALQRYQAGIFPVAGIGGQGTNQTPYYQNNTLGTLGAAATGLGAYLALSDRRAKKDVRKVGERDDGIAVYEFRYKDEKDNAPKRIGFIADDVARVKPEAVFDRDGMQWVDYGALVK